MSPKEKEKMIANLEKEMKDAAKSLQFGVYSRKADFLLPFWPSLLAGICIFGILENI